MDNLCGYRPVLVSHNDQLILCSLFLLGVGLAGSTPALQLWSGTLDRVRGHNGVGIRRSAWSALKDGSGLFPQLRRAQEIILIQAYESQLWTPVYKCFLSPIIMRQTAAKIHKPA